MRLKFRFLSIFEKVERYKPKSTGTCRLLYRSVNLKENFTYVCIHPSQVKYEKQHSDDVITFKKKTYEFPEITCRLAGIDNLNHGLLNIRLNMSSRRP